MVIKSLVDLYEKLLKEGLVSPEGWDKTKISYEIILGPDGKILEVRDIREKVSRQNRTEVMLARLIDLPKAMVRTSGIKANFLWDKASYVFGYDKDKPDKAELCFLAMRRKHHLILDHCDSLCAKALLAFFDSWSLNEIANVPISQDVLDGNFNFCFAVNVGKEVKAVADDPEIRKAWNAYMESLSASDSSVFGVCSVTGKEKQKIAVVHPKVKGVVGADSSGACLVCYNVKSVCSYGLDGEQAINSFVSEYAASAYTKALNWLLSSPDHHTSIGNVTLVYWVTQKGDTESLNESKEYASCTKEVLDDSGKFEDGKLHKMMQCIVNGETSGMEELTVSEDKNFYVLGLGANGSRVAVRFFMTDGFRHLFQNISTHQEQMMIDRPTSVHSIPLWLMLKSTVRSGAAIAAPLLDMTFRSVLENRPYPAALLRNVLQRVYSDSDSNTGRDKTFKINYVKAGVIKAWLLRNCRGRWEDMNSVSLNTECNKKPYLLGRLFAVLEGIQSKALPGINSTIKDRFFNSACRTPAVTFPVLLRLTQYHTRKLNKPLAVYFSKQVGELVDRITVNADGKGFPIRLNPEEQGAFILGYYQQKEAVFKKSKNSTPDNDTAQTNDVEVDGNK